jgi:hypothetical protein
LRPDGTHGGNNIPAITSPWQNCPVLHISDLHTFILEIFEKIGDTIVCYGKIESFRVHGLFTAQPHFSLISFENISFVGDLYQGSLSFAIPIPVEIKPVDGYCADKQ